MNNTTDEECFQEYNENVYQVSDDEEYTSRLSRNSSSNHKLYK